MNKVIYVAIDLCRNGLPFTVTTHSTMEEAKEALHFRLQCDACDNPYNKIEWDEVTSSDEHNQEVVMVVPKGHYEESCLIYVTNLGDRY